MRKKKEQINSPVRTRKSGSISTESPSIKTRSEGRQMNSENSAFAKPLRVLIVEDSQDDTCLLLRELRKVGYVSVYERVETPEAMMAALAKQQWDIIISDYVLPKFSGLAALAVLRETGQDLPFIIVSGNIGEDIAVGAMKAGAHD